MRRFRGAVMLFVPVIVMFAALVAVAPASAALDPAGYRLVDVFQSFPYPYGGVGGYISCPAGMKALSWGATTSGLREVGITAGVTTFDGNGAFITGLGSIGQTARLSMRCVDAAVLQGSTLATAVVSVQDPNRNYGRASCGPGYVAYGGGLFFNVNGQASAGARVYASMPGAAGFDWSAAASGPAASEMVVATHCLPRDQVGQIVGVTATDTAPDEWPRSPNYPVLYTSAHCPEGYAAYAGGAWLHYFGSPLTTAPLGNLTVSEMTYDNRGWFARLDVLPTRATHHQGAVHDWRTSAEPPVTDPQHDRRSQPYQRRLAVYARANPASHTRW